VAEDSGANRWRAVAYRDSVLAYLHERGLHSATRSRSGARDDAAIAGLPWVLEAHRQQTLSLSAAQDEAAARAEEQGFELYGALHYRKNHPVELSYVVLPMHVFAAVLLRLHPEAALPTSRSAA
jgi:hypothetical protein